MCGIYGTTLPYFKDQIQQKLERTQFRGPDQMGIQSYDSRYGKVQFGHNRLSIIDLDPRSNQPFSYGEHIHLVFNGEIYNFKELRAILSQKGYQFKTTSDTEVIAAAYLEFGESCVDHFNGMFAFVIYDVKKQLLFGAKDRLGQKPFYYQVSSKGFEFASQLSSLQLFNTNLTISETAIQSYLAWNSVPHPLSIFEEVKKLKDGHAFTYDLSTQNFKEWPYWDISYPIASPYGADYKVAQNELENLLTEAVKLRMVADVPLGVFLSGGVDSSLIAALAVKDNDQKVKTFSVKFNEDGFDESIYSQKVADHLQTEHHVITCDYKEGLDLIDNFSHYYDEPFADSSAIPSMLLAKYTKQKVTVALTGDGADEAFLGYPRYQKLEKIERIIKWPLAFRQVGLFWLKQTQPNRYHAIKEMGVANSVGEAYLPLMANIDAPWIKVSAKTVQVDELKYLMNEQKNGRERMGDFDLKTYLTWDINTKVDRASMAYSLEARSPFLDYRVIELAQRLPTHFKYGKGTQKRIIKDILYQYVPAAYFDRPKSGFTMPFEVWFRKELKEKVQSELSLDKLRDLPGIEPIETHRRIKEHLEGKWNHTPMIWKLLVLKQWLNINSEGKFIN